jgi:hypothetical protein
MTASVFSNDIATISSYFCTTTATTVTVLTGSKESNYYLQWHIVWMACVSIPILEGLLSPQRCYLIENLPILHHVILIEMASCEIQPQQVLKRLELQS